MTLPTTHVPVVAGLAWIERIERLPAEFTATLAADPDNRFNLNAVAVAVNGQRIGYLPPELSRHYAGLLKGRAEGLECPGRRAPIEAKDNTGVLVLLDCSGIAGPD